MIVVVDMYVSYQDSVWNSFGKRYVQSFLPPNGTTRMSHDFKKNHRRL